MSSIEPGDRFVVEYGTKGRTIEAVALSLRAKRKLIGLVQAVENAGKEKDPVALFDQVEAALRICVPDLTDAQFDTIDEATAMEIVEQTIAGQDLSADERKKSESPPS